MSLKKKKKILGSILLVLDGHLPQTRCVGGEPQFGAQASIALLPYLARKSNEKEENEEEKRHRQEK